MDDLLRLAERVEKLDGPDAEIDRLIHFHVVHPWLAEKSVKWVVEAFGRPTEFLWWDQYRLDAKKEGYPDEWEPFTESIDAAMTLVPEGYCVSAMGEVPDDCDWYCCLWGEHESEGEPERRAKTLPLAIVSAALRARASIGKGEGK
ncbi:hypothetical protein [Sphingobium baderi]|uniref:Phage ABA sandwich domain-containing protein n=1 Tax=Sphingobium baderi LL03 TaxID=1114964 RepID=T0HH65_9SPHN|nr:hypothetical protein [Sphingobium baderi]EQA96883.1 hypothetical protein L485_22650 [Sphingobium baderi LL03]KMS64112.1 hypothetical protein V475_20150 [Sphingobium baderi LL03]